MLSDQFEYLRTLLDWKVVLLNVGEKLELRTLVTAACKEKEVEKASAGSRQSADDDTTDYARWLSQADVCYARVSVYPAHAEAPGRQRQDYIGDPLESHGVL